MGGRLVGRGGAVGLGLLGLVAGGALTWAGRGAPAAADEAPKGAARWEYLLLAEDHKKCGMYAADRTVEVKTWADLARALKVEVKGFDPPLTTVRTQLFNHLGAQGWEFSSQSAMANDTSFAVHYTFRRRLP